MHFTEDSAIVFSRVLLESFTKSLLKRFCERVLREDHFSWSFELIIWVVEFQLPGIQVRPKDVECKNVEYYPVNSASDLSNSNNLFQISIWANRFSALHSKGFVFETVDVRNGLCWKGLEFERFVFQTLWRSRQAKSGFERCTIS